MTALQVHQFPTTGQQLRTVLIDEDPWFVAVDVAAALDLGNLHSSLALLDDDERSLHTVESGQRSMSIVSEAGLYSLILRSRKAEAKAFKRWVTHDVLPAIRRTGQYKMPEQMPSHSQALRGWAEALERAEDAEHRYAIAAPKAEAFNAFMDADGTYSFEQVAKMLLSETGLGRNKLIKKLRELGVLTDKNLPYQRYAHHFHVVASSFEHSDGRRETTYTTRVRATGIEFLRRKLGVAQTTLVTVEEINA